ncbi:S10 family peptidase [Pendulispora albinea]|uniref:Carboxypeptidase n=1 Tax=Pendulispora albinea TaxID=2741071 RepID=A0ABZ2LP55_9BACT
MRFTVKAEKAETAKAAIEKNSRAIASSLKWTTLPFLAAYALIGCAEPEQDAALEESSLPAGEIAQNEGALDLADVPYNDPLQYSDSPTASLSRSVEAAAVTHRTWQVDGRTQAYTATTGHLTAFNRRTNKADASFFYIGYTADGPDGKPDPARPVTFVYNGGPGSSTVWLLMSSFGPKRNLTNFPQPTPAPSQNRMIDNPESILAKTDLVFVNAVGTAYSEAIAPNTNRTFWGVDADANVFAQFIDRYLTVNGRRSSPKFLLGESYGTLRSGALSLILQNMGVHLNGITLHSSILDYGTSGNIDGLLPTYGATAWYHQKAAEPYKSMNIRDYVAFLRTYTSQTFQPAYIKLRNGTLPDSERRTICADLQDMTGIASQRWYDGRFEISNFRSTLISGRVVGRLDSRVVGSSGDPSDAANSNTPLMFPPYLKDDLKYGTSSPFRAMSNAISYWNWSHNGSTDPDVTVDLAETMKKNPDMKVFSVNGYYDVATPFYQAELDLAGMPITPDLRKNISYAFYTSGHMVYLDNSQRTLQRNDFFTFYDHAMSDPALLRRVTERQLLVAGL